MKRVLSLLLAFVFLLSLLPLGLFDLTANAATEGYLSYSVSNGEAEITDCDTSISGAITIPSTLGGYPVTSIGSSAFYNCSGLTSVTIGNSVTSIGSSAFFYCSSLTSVTIPDSVTTIGSHAFRECSKLTSVAIPDSVTDIGSSAFYNCSKLTSVTIGNSVTTIGSYAFYGCSGLLSVTIPNSVASIGSSAFYGCSGLTSVAIPGGVTSIGEDAFRNCSSLTAVYITDLAAWCAIEFGYYSANPLYYGKNLYLNGTLVENPVIPDSVTSISSYAFDGCRSLQSVTIPDSVTSIGSYAFRNCSSLQSVTIPDSVTSIGSSAFDGCSSLTSVAIPDSVTSIDAYAFRNCSSLQSVTIPDSVTTIGSSAFNGCSSLESVTIPDSVTSIGEYAFWGCSSLTSVTIPASVTTIGEGAFYGCSSLWHVHFLGDMPTMESDAFNYCASDLKLCYMEGTKGWESCSYTTELGTYNQSTDCVSFIFTCTVCPASYSRPSEDAHAWDSGKVTAASCTEDGVKTYTCADCGKTKEELLPAMGHDTVTVSGLAATCTTAGYTESSYCSRCGEVFVPQEEIPALGHDVSYVAAKAPTCTEAGSRSHYVCTRCQKYYTDPECQFEMPASYAIIAALGHSEVVDAAVAATCTSTGLTEGSHCDRCGEVLVAQKETPMTTHSLIYVEERAATCTQAGNQAHYACENCGNYFFDGEGQYAAPDSYVIVNALGHSFVEGVCACGAVDVTVPILDANLSFGAQLYLENDLTMAFRVKSSKLANYDLSTAYLVVEREVYETGAKESYLMTTTINEYTVSGDRIIFSYPGISAAQMNDAIKATLYVKTASGQEYVSPVLETSVATYLNGLLGTYANDSKMLTLIMDMLNYGAAAQIYFDRHADSLVNEAFESFKTYASYASADFSTALEDLSATENAEGKSGKLNLGLDLGTRIGIQYKVTLPADIAAEDVSLVIKDANGNTLETLALTGEDVTVDSRGRYIVSFYGSTSKDMRRVVYATAYANGTAITGTYAYSNSTYAWGTQENASTMDAKLVAVTRAMMLYGDSATEYFK